MKFFKIQRNDLFAYLSLLEWNEDFTFCTIVIKLCDKNCIFYKKNRFFFQIILQFRRLSYDDGGTIN